MSERGRNLRRLCGGAVWLLASGGAAQADCLVGLGTTGCPDRETFSTAQLRSLTCEGLWHVRITIYDAHGYCFRTPRAREAYDNGDCTVEDAGAILLNPNEQNNVLRVRQMEAEKSCQP